MTKEEIIEFGKWVKDTRLRLNITQTELARRLDVAKGSISSIESGTTKAIGPKMVKKIKECLENENTATPVENRDAAESITPLLKRLAVIITAPDFDERVAGIQKILHCSKEKAIFTVFYSEVQNDI